MRFSSTSRRSTTSASTTHYQDHDTMTRALLKASRLDDSTCVLSATLPRPLFSAFFIKWCVCFIVRHGRSLVCCFWWRRYLRHSHPFLPRTAGQCGPWPCGPAVRRLPTVEPHRGSRWKASEGGAEYTRISPTEAASAVCQGGPGGVGKCGCIRAI